MKIYRERLVAGVARGWRRWCAYSIPNRMAIALGLFFAWRLLTVPMAPPVHVPPPRDPNGKIIRRFEDLTEKNRKFVKDNYQALLDAYFKKDFARMSDSARNILSLVDEYNDTKSYEVIAKRGLEAVEEERKRRENEERQRYLREQVGNLMAAARINFGPAVSNPSLRPQFLDLVNDIISKDPNNFQAQEWRKAIVELTQNENRQRATREIASLEIKGEGLLKKARDNPDARADLYQIIDRLRSIDPANTYPGEWKERLHKGKP